MTRASINSWQKLRHVETGLCQEFFPSIRKSIFKLKYNIYLHKLFLYKKKVITYSHGKLSTITIQVRVTNIQQKSSNAVQEDKDCKSNIELRRRGVISNKDIIFPIYTTDISTLRCLKWCFIQPEWITKSSSNRFILRTCSTRHLNFCFALKTSTGSKSKDRSNPLEDFDEAERLLERVEVELEGGHPLREGGKEC